jgi:hypothetical protein
LRANPWGAGAEIAGNDESVEKILNRPHGELTKLTKPFSPDARKALAWEDIADEETDLRLDDGQKRQLAESLKKAQRDIKETLALDVCGFSEDTQPDQLLAHREALFHAVREAPIITGAS